MRMRKGRVAKLGRMQTGRMHVLAMGLQFRRGLESILRPAADGVEDCKGIWAHGVMEGEGPVGKLI